MKLINNFYWQMSEKECVNKMKKYLYCVVLLMAVLFVPGLAKGNTVKVYLLGGQSNMDGKAPGSGLPTSPVNLQQEQTDVLFYQGNASGGSYLPGNTLIYLAPGSGSKSPSSPTFGPEVTFGRAMADSNPQEQYAIIKHALGGSKLATDWNPATGAVYAAFRDTVAGGLAALTSAGYDYEIVGMLWMQGESDKTEEYANAYQSNLTAFIADIRSRYGRNLPFVIAETWVNLGDDTYPGPLGDIVSGAQQAVANGDPYVGFVSTRNSSFLSDDVHLNASGQMDLGYQMADCIASTSSPYQAEVIGHWSFDNDYSDVSGNGFDGILVDAGTPGNSGITMAAGEYRWGGGALNVSGERDYVEIDQIILPADGDGYSISFWGRDRNAVENQDGMALGDYNDGYNFIWIDGDLKYRGVSKDYTADFILIDGENTDWHHYVIVVSAAADVTLYVDGIAVGIVPNVAGDVSIQSIGHAYSSATYNFDYDGQIDEVWLFSNAIGQAVVDSLYGSNDPYRNSTAVGPNPANGKGLATNPSSALYIEVPVDQNLSWLAPTDPNLDVSYGMTYAVYADPNREKVENGDLSTEYYRGFEDNDAAQLSFDPQVDLSYKTTYYWRVDTKARMTGQSNSNIFVGSLWKFKTVTALPNIISDLENVKIKSAETASFTVSYESISAITGVTWFKNDVAVSGDSEHIIAWDQSSSTLTISNADVSDFGSYYCIVENVDGTATSASANLVEKKLVAWYEFEQNADDSVGSNDGAAVPSMNYSTGQTGSYAADPNDSNYILLSTDSYPNNQLEELTLTFWVKKGDSDGYILGSFNEGSNTAIQVGLTADGELISYFRQDGSRGISNNITGLIMDTDQWHYIALNFDGVHLRVYLDGMLQAETTNTSGVTNLADWQYPMVLCARNLRGSIQDFFSGELDDLRIFNYVLTDEDIAQEYYDVTGKASCILDYASGFDLSGPNSKPDCVVNLYDFVELAANWLSTGLYPVE